MRKQSKETKQVTDPEEAAVEARVKEVMGPAQRFDGSKPSAAELSEMEAAGLITEHEPEAVTIPVRRVSTPVEAPEKEQESVDLPSEKEESSVPEEPAEAIEPSVPEQSEVAQLTKKLEAEIEEGIEELDVASLGISDVNETEKVAEEVRSELMAARSIPVNDHGNAEPVIMKQNAWQRFIAGLRSWWDNPRKRYGLLIGLLVLVGLLLFVPRLRALSLNAVGYRSGLIVHAVDRTTSMPLSGVSVKVGEITGKTDADGMLRLKKLPLGSQQVVISKPAYATVNKQVEIGVRVADLGDVDLKLTGQRYTYLLKDYVTHKPIKDAVLQAGEASVASDKTGKAQIALIPPDDEPLSLTVTAEGYRKETVMVPADAAKPVGLQLVKYNKEVYVSKQSGRYDVFSVDLDGKNSQVLLAGTGLETPQIALQMSPDGKKVAVVSTRDDKRNADGYLLSALTIVDVASGDAAVIEHAEAITLVGWQKSALVFKTTVAGVSAANANRQKIMLFDTAKDKRLQLASANNFLGQWLGSGKLYYAASGTGADKTEGFLVVGLEGDGRKQLLGDDIWEVQRGGLANYWLKTATKWYQFKLGNDGVGEVQAPSLPPSTYVNSPSGAQTAQLEKNAAPPVLRIINAAGRVKTLQTGLALHSVVRWVGEDTLIVRTVTGSEAVEYVVSVGGGEPKKIVDTIYGL